MTLLLGPMIGFRPSHLKKSMMSSEMQDTRQEAEELIIAQEERMRFWHQEPCGTKNHTGPLCVDSRATLEAAIRALKRDFEDSDITPKELKDDISQIHLLLRNTADLE